MHDPTASAHFRETHKRRLEALLRAGLTERLTDGRWRIAADHLERAARYEQSRASNTGIEVKSWLPIEELIEREAHGWLDKIDAPTAVNPLANDINDALTARRAFLKREQYLGGKRNKTPTIKTPSPRST